MGKLALWADNIVNHFWYCCESANDNVDILKVITTHGIIIHDIHVALIISFSNFNIDKLVQSGSSRL